MLQLTDSGTGRTIVALHAYPCDHTMWDAQADAFVAGGYRVIRPDLPGFGGSPMSQEPPLLGIMAQEVLAALDGAGVQDFVLVGLSMGGYVAMEMLRRQPERVTTLALLDTKATADGPDAAALRFEAAAKAEAAGSLTAMAQAMLPGLLGSTTLAQRPEVVARTRTYIDRASGAGAAWAMRAMAQRPDSLGTLAAFQAPALVIMGSEDALSSLSEHEAMAAALPAGSLVVIPECGHLSALEQPAAVNEALLAFLAATG